MSELPENNNRLVILDALIVGLNFEKTECTVKKVEMLKKGSCSLKTDRFTPCYKIMVSRHRSYIVILKRQFHLKTYQLRNLVQAEYNTTKEIKISVLMENEQTVYHCEKVMFEY